MSKGSYEDGRRQGLKGKTFSVGFGEGVTSSLRDINDKGRGHREGSRQRKDIETVLKSRKTK
jgi:hypothetical protein